MKFPVLLYDDYCTSCTEFAKFVDEYLKGRITTLGLYSNVGIAFCNIAFPKGFEVRVCSWFCNNGYAYGGRNCMFHLLKYIIFDKKQSDFSPNDFDDHKCVSDCATVKGVALRSFSAFTMSKKVKLNNINIT